MVYDPGHHQFILFGGEDSSNTPLAETWLYTSGTWTHPIPAHSPPARIWAGMAYDGNNHNVVLFGGCSTQTCTTYESDTWTWNGTDWTNTGTVGPSGRQGPSMAYEGTTNKKVVLFGGSSSVGNALQDTWFWSGTAWTNQTASVGNPPFNRRFASMTWDPIRGQLVLFGGDDGGNYQPDTWTFGAGGWVKPSPAHTPGARSSQGQAWDPVRQLTVLFSGNPSSADTWTWNGTDWSQETTLASPGPTLYVNMDYDIQHDNIMLFGGLSGSVPQNSTWTLGFTYKESWFLVSNSQSNFSVVGPPALVNASAVNEGAEVLFFGGSDGTNTQAQTWLWFGDQWAILNSAMTEPPARQNAALATDPNGFQVLFGGNSSATATALLSDTWFYDGFWNLTSAVGPSAREGHAMTFDADPAIKQTLLYGGFTGTYNNETWTWNGTSWAQLSPAANPGPRAYHQMVYDAARNQVVLFGGYNGSTYLSDTWIWNGTTWTQMLVAGPPGRAHFSMVYDSVHGTVQLFGGQNASGQLGDTWQWDGVSWTDLNTLNPSAISPPARSGMASAYFPQGGQFVIFGGSNGTANQQESWVLTSPFVTGAHLPLAFLGQSYSYTIVPLGGVGPYTITQNGFPQSFSAGGLTLNSTTGVVSGTASGSEPPDLNFGATITDAQGQATILSFQLTTDTLISFSGTLPPGTMTVNYNLPLSTVFIGGTAPFTYTASNLPAGITLNVDKLVGQCTGASTTVNLGVMDTYGQTASASGVTLGCNPYPVIQATSPLDVGAVGEFYDAFMFTNAVYSAPGAAPFTWSATSSLPAGLSISASGQILGTPTAAGTANFSVTFTDRWGATTTKPFQITINPALTINTHSLPNGTLNITYPLTQFSATGGIPQLVYGAFNLPPGLSINPTTAIISGTPTSSGTYNAQVFVEDDGSGSASATFTITVAPAGTNSVDWVQQFPANPPGARNAASTFYDSVRNLTVVFGGYTASEPGIANDTNTWNGAAWSTLSPAHMPSTRGGAATAFDPVHGVGVLYGGTDGMGGVLGDTWLWNGTDWSNVTNTGPSARAYASMAWDGHQIVMYGGTVDFSTDLNETWTWNGATWTQQTTGTTGTPPSGRDSAAVAYDSAHGQVVLFGGYFQATNTDSAETWIWNGSALTWTQLTPANPPTPREGHVMAYDALHGETILFSGYSHAQSMDLGDTWEWNGTTWTNLTALADNPADRSFATMAYDAAHSMVVLFGGSSDFFEGSINDTWVFEGPVATPLALPNGTQNVSYGNPLPVVGGLAPLTYTAGNLPSWLTFDPETGIVFGTPPSTGDFLIPVTVQDAAGLSIAPTYTLHISPLATPLVLSPLTLPSATAGFNYTAQLSASGGVTPYIFSTSGLPTGLHLNSGNQIVGQCSGANATNVMLTVTDSATPTPNQTSVGPLHVNCNAVPLITTASPLASGLVNSPYSANLSASGGTAPLTWALTPGTLPAGFALNATTGVLTGTPTSPVTSQFTATVTDIWGASANQLFSVSFTTAMGNPNWTSLSPTTPPGARDSYAMSIASTGTLLYGGNGFNDTYVFSFPSTWTLQSPASHPTAQFGTSLAYLASQGVDVLFGGQASGALFGETWVWNAGNWTKPTLVPSPSARYFAGMAPDRAHNQLVLFGGSTATTGFAGANNETWVYDGTAWTHKSPSTVPTAAFAPMLADGPTGPVMFGGLDPSGNEIPSTYVWDGINWNQKSPAHTPSPRDAGGMVYQAASNVTILFGGYDGTNHKQDTWAWNGTDWTSLSPANIPAARDSINLAYDAGSNQVYMFGGYEGPAPELGDTWTLGGPTVQNTTLTTGNAGAPYSSSIAVLGGTAGYTFSQSGNPQVLPTGLNLNGSTGQITGATESTGTFNVGISVVDSQGLSTVPTFHLTINPTSGLTLSPTTLPDATAGANYTAQLSATGGLTPYFFAAANLPAGLHLNSGNQIVGTCTAGSATVNLSVTDSSLPTAQVSSVGPLTVHCNAAPLITAATPLANGIVNTPYSATITMTGGTAPFLWTLTPGTLPAGFVLNPNTGVLTGTATAPVTAQFNAAVSDFWGASTNKAFTVTFYPVLTISSTSLPTATQGASYTGTTLAVTGGTGSGTYHFTATGFPTGLAIDPVSGAITGIPTQSGPFTPTFTVTDQTPQSVMKQISLTVTPAGVLTLSPTALQDATAGANYMAQLSALGGVTPYVFTATNLPAGLHLNGSNQIVGQCTAASTNVMLGVTDSATPTANVASVGPLTVHCNAAPAITTTSPIANGIVGTAYNATLSNSGGTAPFNWVLTPGTLPAGFALNASTGVLTGTATTATSASFSAAVSDLWGATANKSFTVTFYPVLTITSTTLPTGVQGTAYPSGTVLAVTGGTGSANYHFSAIGLPPGLAIDPASGAITGMPTQFGAFNPTFTVTDSTPQSVMKQIALTVATAGTLTLSPNSLPDATVGANYTAQLSAVGGVTPYTFSATGLPAGLHLNVNNQIVGQCTAASTTVMLGVTDSATPTANSSSVGPLTVHCNVAPSITSTSPIANGIVGTAYSATLSNSGGTAPFTWSLIPGTLPAGFVLNASTGVLTGTATTAASAQFNASVSDVWGASANKAFTVTFYPVLTVTSTSLPTGVQGSSYPSTILAVTGGTGTGTYHFSATGFPTGLAIDPVSGAITGIPTQFGAFNPTFTVTDQTPQSVQKQLALTVAAAGSLTLSPTTLPDATAGANYSAQLSAAGGVTPYTFTATGLPAGLHLNSGNQIVGQCTAASTNVMLGVTDSATPSANTASIGPLTVHCNAAPSITSTSPLANGIVNTPYSATLTMSGGTAPFTWSLTPGTLPTGFALNATTGVLTGTATAAASAQFSVSVSDLWGASTNKAFTLTFYPVLTISTTSLPNGTAGTAYPGGTSIAATGGTGGSTYAFSATGLPSGFSIDPVSGILSGTTVQTGSFTPTFKVTDQTPQSVTKQLNLTIVAGSGISFLSPTLLPTGTSGQPYSYQLQWTGGIAPYTVTGAGLPVWLHVNATTGALSGTPPTGGAFNLPITVTDSQTPTANTASLTFTLVVNPPSISSPSPLPAATIGIAYSQILTATAGAAPYTWTSSNLPLWLSLSSGGVLSGTPPVGTPASIPLTVMVTDSLGAFVTGNLTLPVLPTGGLLFQTTSPLPPATLNVPYTTTVQALGGDGVFLFSASGLPTWLSINGTTGVLTGTPPAAGPVTFQLTVSDDVNQTLSQMFTLPVNASLTLGTTSPLPPATVGVAYSGSLLASGGSGSYTWSATKLPSWLQLSPAGVFSGTPTQAGPVTFNVTVQDTLNNSVSQIFTLPVDAALTINTASPLPAATANFLYMANFGASGGGGGYQWSATGLPTGFSLTAAGVLTGTPQSASPITFSVTVKDSINNSLTQNFTLPVNATVTITTVSPLTAATVLIPYSASFAASGGNPGYTWTQTGLPTWLTLTAAGFLSGTPPANATAVTFQVTVTDSASHSVTQAFTLPVNNGLLITSMSLPVATVNVPYSTTLTATGGSGVYTWSSPGVPAGLTLSAAGVLSGTNPQPGPYAFQVKVVDNLNVTASASLTLLVSTGLPLSITTQSLANCVTGSSCTAQFAPAGGIPPYTFSVPPNTQLGGLSLSASGFLSGTPTSSGQITIPVILTDQLISVTKTFTETVFNSLSITTGSLNPGTVGVSYGAGLTASGGQPPYRWSLYSGALPGGLTLDSVGGSIYGSPTAAGSFTFSIQVADGQQTSTPRQYTVVVSAPPTPLTVSSPSQLAPATVGTAYSQLLMASGGSGQYSWTLMSGALPAGLNLAASGAITGTPTTAQTASFTLKVSDTSNNSLTPSFSILVTNPLTVSLLAANPLPNGAVGIPYNYPILVTGGTPPYFYSITQGQVPPGLTFNSTNGTLTGTPITQGAFSLVLSVVDSSGAAGGLAGGPTAKLSNPRVGSSAGYTIQIAGTNDFQITTPGILPAGTLGQNYSFTMGASNGTPPYQWSLQSGNLPTGLTLNSAGRLTGTPSAAGVSSFLIRAVDNAGNAATGSFQLQIVNANVPTISSAPAPPDGTVGVAYQAPFTAAGGRPPYTWSLASGGGMPPGLALNPSAGAITGTPTQKGLFAPTLQVTDSAGAIGTQNFTIRVTAALLKISPTTIPIGIVNLPYSAPLSVTGGVAPYTWSLSAGGLLTGFSIDPNTGTVSGTPTQAGTYQFTISVVDSNLDIGLQTFQYVVQNSQIGITTASTPAATIGTAYNFGLTAANGNGALTWTVISGNLPPGIQLGTSSGQLTGTPTTAGSYPFTVQVVDVTTATAKANFTIVVSPPPVTIVTASLLPGSVATAYSQTLRATGGQGSIAWSVTSGNLPPGLTLAGTTGVISGTPSTMGSYPFTVQATAGSSATASLSINITGPPAAPAITLSGLPATSNPGDQPVVAIGLSSAYPLPITVTATLSISPKPAGASDLMFSNGTTAMQLTIPANATQASLPFQVGTLAGTIQLSLDLVAAGVDITPSVAPTASTKIVAAAPVIKSVAVTTSSSGLQVTVVGLSTTLDMKTAAFHFAPVSGATLTTTDINVDVSAQFAAWYQSAASLPTGSQFSFNIPFTIGGSVSTINSVTVTMTNSVGGSTPVTTIVP